MPVYNGADYVADAIESVLEQSYPNIELIVVDDGSRDATADVIARYSDRVVSIRQENQGLAAARNTGFHRSTGDYVAWIDHDDIWMPEKISVQLALMEAHPECVISSTEFSAFDASGFFERTHAAKYYSIVARRGLDAIFSDRRMLPTRDVPTSRPLELPESIPVYMGDVRKELLLGNCLHPPTVMIRRSAYVAAGLSEARFGSDTDYELFLRVAKHGRAAFIDHPLLRYRYSAGQMSGDKNLAKITRSLIGVLEHLTQEDPTLLDQPLFKQRVAKAHLDAAWAVGEKERMLGLRHLMRGLSYGGFGVDRQTAVRTAAKLVTPPFLATRYRRHRTKLDGT